MAKTIFWFMSLLIFYTYIGYPLVIFLLSIFINKQINRRDIEPLVTILIAAYNEEKGIKTKLENTLQLDYPKDKLEIIVVSDGSTDKTDDIVNLYKHKQIKLFRVEGRVGKTEARNRALKIAKGEIIVFSDATTNYDKFAIRKMVRNFYDPSVGAVSGHYDYINSKNSSMGLANILFWKYENFIKSKQSQTNTLTGMSGCINSFRKHLYEPLPRHIIEDLVEPLKILEKGYRIIFETEAQAYEVSTSTTQEELKMRIRVISQGIQGLLYVRKLLNPLKYRFISFQLFSHKIMRWLIPFFLVGLFISNIFIFNKNLFYSIIFIVQIIFYLLALLGLFFQKTNFKLKIFSFPLYFCALNLASFIAFFRVLRGKNIEKWETIR